MYDNQEVRGCLKYSFRLRSLPKKSSLSAGISPQILLSTHFKQAPFWLTCVEAMSSLQISPQYVYQGFWIDWSYGKAFGSTITTTQNIGTLVVALLAVLIQITGSHFWDLIVFFIYISRAKRGDHDGFFYQQQILLRNNNGPRSILLDFIKLSLVWRYLVRRSYYRNLHMLLLAALVGSGFIVAGVLSSFVVSGLNIQILASSSLCGFFN